MLDGYLQEDVLQTLENEIKETSGRVEAEWGKEVWGMGEPVNVLKLFIRASTSFQSRALTEALDAAGEKDLFHLHMPTSRNPNGYLSISKDDALNPIHVSAVERVIANLWSGKERAGKFKIEDVKNAAQSVFGNNVVINCNKEGEPCEELLKVTVSHAETDYSKEFVQHFLTGVTSRIFNAISEPWREKMALQITANPADESMVLSLDPAYADEFSKACRFFKSQLTPKAIENQLKL
ncbi:MAG: hypothetical protein AB7S81_06105 [Bdellovibrionales bacterium]